MTIKKKIIISLITLICIAKPYSYFGQNFSGIYKINDLLKRTKNKDTTYVVNFWATWCKPCVQELPAFDSLLAITNKSPIKIILVSLDFKEDIDTKLKPFISTKNIKCQVVLLDELNGNDYINLISEKWSGAIPATQIKHNSNIKFVEKKIHLQELQTQIAEVNTN